jgi:hypothetical protein
VVVVVSGEAVDAHVSKCDGGLAFLVGGGEGLGGCLEEVFEHLFLFYVLFLVGGRCLGSLF